MSFPPLPDPHGIAVLALVGLALVLFTSKHLKLETSSLMVLVILLIGFELFPYEANGEQLRGDDFFSGFGHEALIAVCALMIVGNGLVRTGALEPLGRLLATLWKYSPSLSLLLTLVISGLLSAFVNNVPIVVLLLPILVSVAHRTSQKASGLLMPMGFATIVGGMSTTIGTSTNLLVVTIASDLGMERFGMFDFFLPAVIAASVAVIYLWLVAPRLLGDRDTPLGNFSPRVFVGHLHVEEESFANGKTVTEVIEKSGGNMTVAQIFRGEDRRIVPLPDMILKEGDRIAVRDTPENLKEYEETLGTKLYNEDNVRLDEDIELRAEGQQIAEIVVTQGSPLQGRTLSNTRFDETHHLVVLALHREGQVKYISQKDMSNVVLRTGDVLLVQGTEENITELKKAAEVLVLDATEDLPHTKKAPVALSIMAGVVLVAAVGIVPITISAVCGVLLMVMTGCLNWRDAAGSLNAQVILIVTASLALGSSLLQTGGADYLAEVFLALTYGASPAFVLAGLMIVMAVLTNIVSNNAAAVIGTPIAITIANRLGLPPEAFVLAVLFGANMSYATPMAYKTNLLVMNAGGYHFTDFTKVGVPLIVLLLAVFSFILPMIYGF
ncbi:SLC13 family permease [Terasakiella pusilla]|jgi:di/tricarboxylate transporter|uniref:SLC13 family permease n=1 Tax=Terasakiella pusilla TaxID=64973 RepID=UPI003AA7CC24